MIQSDSMADDGSAVRAAVSCRQSRTPRTDLPGTITVTMPGRSLSHRSSRATCRDGGVVSMTLHPHSVLISDNVQPPHCLR
jgi:hypothetical protein